MGVEYSGVIVSPNKEALETVSRKYFGSVEPQYFDRHLMGDEPRYPRLYVLYYNEKPCAPDYRNGPDILADLDKVPWKWEFINWDYATSHRDIQKETNALWDALNLKLYSHEPVLDTETTIRTSLGVNW